MLGMKLDQIELEKRLSNRYVELTSDYINFKTRSKFKCLNCNGFFECTLDSLFQRKNLGCAKCSKEQSKIKQKLDFNYICNFFCKNDCILLENKYINAHQKMKYICCCGSLSEINFNNFKNGRRCKCCAIIRKSGKNHYGWIKDRNEYELRKRTRDFCYKTVQRCLRSNKDKSSYQYLGYGPLELINHIKSHENWNSIKERDWHIDHIFPLKAFFDYEIYDIKVINRLDNIQPMLAVDNLKKNSKYSKNKFKEYLTAIGY